MNFSGLLLVTFTFVNLVLTASSSLNFYINRTESKRILGGLPRWSSDR